MSAERTVHSRIKEQFGHFAAPEPRGPEGKADPRFGPRQSLRGEHNKVCYLPYSAFGYAKRSNVDLGGGSFITLAGVDPTYTTGIIAWSKVFQLGATVWEGLENQIIVPATTALSAPTFSSNIGTQATLSNCTIAAYGTSVTVSSTTGLAAGMLVSASTPGYISPSTIIQTVVDGTHLTLSQPALQSSATASLTFWATSDGTSQLNVSAPVFLGGNLSGVSLVLQPLRLGVKFAVSKQLLTQSPKIFVPVLRDQISRSISAMIDSMALYGTGPANGQVTGLFVATGSPTKLSFNMTWANYQSWRTAILQTNLEPNTYGGIVSPGMLSFLDSTQAYSGASFSIWEKMRDSIEDRFVVGNEINANTQMNTGNGVILGIWRWLYIALWNDGVQIEFDDYSMADSFATVVRCTVLMNVACPFPAAFTCAWQ
jgi:hypothetical protein